LQERRKETDVEGRLTKLTSALEEKLKGYLGGPLESFQNGVRDIIESAVDLDAEFSKQRAHYYTRSLMIAFYSKPHRQWVERHCIYNRKTMENVEGNVDIHGPCRISLVVRPMLHKAGNNFGDSYVNLEVVLVKALVTTEHYLKDTREKSKPPKLKSKKEEREPGKLEPISEKKAGKQRVEYDYSGLQRTRSYINPTPPLNEPKREKIKLFSGFRKIST
jgi:hypothetical protein